MNPRDLPDDELSAQAHAWRRRALRGDKHARGTAHELECEMRRRFGVVTTVDAPSLLPEIRQLSVLPQAPTRRWRLWGTLRSS